jgi:ribosomal protein S8
VPQFKGPPVGHIITVILQHGYLYKCRVINRSQEDRVLIVKERYTEFESGVLKEVDRVTHVNLDNVQYWYDYGDDDAVR